MGHKSVLIVLAILAVVAVLLFYINKIIKGRSIKQLSLREQLFSELRQCTDEVEVLGGKILDLLEFQRDSLCNLIRMLQYSDRDYKEDLDVLNRMQYYSDDLVKSWRQYIEFVKQECCVIRIKANRHEKKYIEKLSDSEKVLKNDILPMLGGTQPTVKALAEKYLEADMQLQKFTADFSENYAACNRYEQEMLAYMRQGEKKLAEESFTHLKESFNKLKISGNKVLEALKSKKSILDNLEKDIHQYGDEKGEEVFFHLQQYYRDSFQWWEDHIKSVEHKYALININIISKHVQKSSDICMGESDQQSLLLQFKNDIVPKLRKMQFGVKEYLNYFSADTRLSQSFSDFDEARVKLSQYIKEIMNHEEQKGITVLSVNDITIPVMSCNTIG
ncbi:hypothetical protein K6025_02750 [Ehrlichia sp. JZT12]